MAKKAGEYTVINGCIQEDGKVYDLGSPYTPPTEELAVELEQAGIIAPAKPAKAAAAGQVGQE